MCNQLLYSITTVKYLGTLAGLKSSRYHVGTSPGSSRSSRDFTGYGYARL